MNIIEIKRKLRELKSFETRVRFGGLNVSKDMHYIWNDFFSTKDETDCFVKYNLKKLLDMERPQLKDIYEEYFYCVYYQFYKETGMLPKGVYDVDLLSNLGLPMDSSMEEIKKRFRELAKLYHPDSGGDGSKFIELLDTYNRLMDED